MKLYQTEYKDKKTGKKKKCSCWYLTFIDNKGIRRRLQGYKNKQSTDTLGDKIQSILDANGRLDTDLRKWFSGLIPRVQKRLLDFELIDDRGMLKHADKNLTEHLLDFEQFLLAKNNTPGYSRRARTNAERVFAACQFRNFYDIDANAVACFLKGLRDKGAGQRTSNSLLQSAKQFLTWAIKTRRTTGPNPLDYIDPVTQTEVIRKRRAITVHEIRRLITATAAAPFRFKLSGYERSLMYRLAIESGLRAGELRSLTKSSFDFNANTVTVLATNSKRRKEDTLPLNPKTASEIKAMLENKMPTVKVFTASRLTAEMLRKDLKDAGIEYCVDGRYYDFHSLRHQTGTLLAAAGVDVKSAQTLMRHSDVNLTMSLYTHSLAGSSERAIAKMPDLTAKPDDLTDACQTA